MLKWGPAAALAALGGAIVRTVAGSVSTLLLGAVIIRALFVHRTHLSRAPGRTSWAFRLVLVSAWPLPRQFDRDLTVIPSSPRTVAGSHFSIFAVVEK